MEFSGLLIPGEDGLGPGTTSRGADAQDLLKCAMIILSFEDPGQFFAAEGADGSPVAGPVQCDSCAAGFTPDAGVAPLAMEG